MNLSGGRCFCLMLGLSLLAHGGLFLNRSPLARLCWQSYWTKPISRYWLV